MQRLVYLCSGTSRLIQVVNVKNNRFFYEKQNLIFSRCLATKNKGPNTIDTHPDLYKPSTAKQETHVPDSLKGRQSTDTIETISKKTLTGAGKVWSAQNPDDIHVAPLGRVKATTFVAKSNENGKAEHQTTVYTTQGELNIADPFKTHTLQPEATSAQSAEAAAASAFASDTPAASKVTTEPVFTPKISSTDTYSTTTSPTAHFDTATPPSTPASQQEPVRYETAAKGKVFGGQDTSAESRKHPKENPFNLKEQVKPPRQAK